MSEDFLLLLDEFEKEKGISRDVLIEALEVALVSAYKRNYGTNQNVKVKIDKTPAIWVFLSKTVVEEVVDSAMQISLEDAKKLTLYKEGDAVEIQTAPQTFDGLRRKLQGRLSPNAFVRQKGT